MEAYVRDLSALYGNYATFRYDPLAGDVIGVKWNSIRFGAKPVSLSRAFALSVHPSSSSAQKSNKKKKKKNSADAPFHIPNIFEIVAGMRKLGDGVVQDIHMSHASYAATL